MTKKNFDLVASLQNMFTRAEAEQDYAGAASIARVLRDLSATEAEEPESHGGPFAFDDFEKLTPSEMARWDAQQNAVFDLEAEVAARLGVSLTPAAEEAFRLRVTQQRIADDDAEYAKRMAEKARVEAATPSAPDTREPGAAS